MKKQPQTCSGRPQAPERGVALVLTLLIIAMLVVVVAGFVSVSRLEQIAARNFTHQAVAQQMAQLATGQAIARLTEAVQAGVAAGTYLTQPGRILPFGPEAGGPELLFSQGANSININSITTNGFVTGEPADNISVGLTDVFAGGNQLVGRVAYYISDESVKLPVNHARGGRNFLNPVPPRPFAISGVDVNLQNSAIVSFDNILSGTFTNSSISNWSYFFTTEQLASAVTNIGPVRSRRTTVATETNATLAARTPWGTPKIRINELPLTEESVSNIVTALTNQRLVELFGGHFGTKYGEQGVVQLAANMLQLRSDHWGSGPRFDGADPVLGTNSISGDVAAPPSGGMRKKTNGIPEKYLGYVPFPMLTEIAVGVLYGWTAPNRMTTLVSLEYELKNPFPVRYEGGGEIRAQIDKARFAMFYPADPPDRPFSIVQYRGPDGTAASITPHNDQPSWQPGFAGVWDPWGADDPNRLDFGVNRIVSPADGVSTTNIPSIPAFGTFRGFLGFSVTFDETNRLTFISDDADPPPALYCIIDSIKLLSTPGDPASIRDWCSGNDLFNALSSNEVRGPAQFRILVTPANGPLGTADAGGASLAPASAPPPTMKLVRVDPRLKPGLEESTIYKSGPPGKVWNYVPYEDVVPGPNDFADSTIPADLAFADDLSMAVYNTNIPPILALSSGSPVAPPQPGAPTPEATSANYSIAADLGKVFTGLPWRTLRMQPQPATEVDAGFVPDWVLLDMVDFSAANSAFAAVNPNLRYISAVAPVRGFGSGMRGQLNVLTNQQAIQSLVNPLSPEAAVLTNAVSLADAGVALNQAGISNVLSRLGQLGVPASWANATAWLDHRTETLSFPEEELLLASEITEIEGVANYNTTADEFKMNEYRLSALFPGLGTRSRFFKISAVGQAVEGTANVAVSATALLQTLVEVDDSTTPPSVRIIQQYPPAN